MKCECVIIGGGAAGLCAATRLAELGIISTLIEAGSYPTHKVCGEFFSSDALPILKNWGIQPFAIKQAYLRTTSHNLLLNFPEASGSLSHLCFDPALAQLAQQKGAKILTHTKVINLHPKQIGANWHTIELSTGEILQADILIIATGRLPNNKQPTPQLPYIGIKTHFKNIPIRETLEMFFIPGAYLGVAPIEEGKYNMACLVKKELVEGKGSVKQFIQHLIAQHPLLASYLNQGEQLMEWMSVSVPHFGIKKTPKWPDTYFIGDAFGTTPPATGNGLSLAIKSGYLAAEFAKKRDPVGFYNTWRSKSAASIFWGKLLHHTLMQPFLGKNLITCASFFPKLAIKMFQLTRQKN